MKLIIAFKSEPLGSLIVDRASKTNELYLIKIKIKSTKKPS